MTGDRELFRNIFESIDFDRILDHPNILIAAHFWDDKRYQAARTCYKFMRAIDDFIDNRKADKKRISRKEKEVFTAEISKWLEMLSVEREVNGFQAELLSSLKDFRIPHWPLEAFARSMVYDVNHDGFATLDTFIDYSQGASVAPASIFVHLAGLQESGNGYHDPPFNVRNAATPCAMFSYLVHIMRDFRKDQLNNLNYFADDIIIRNGLTRSDLSEIAHGAPVKAGFRQMMREYYFHAEGYMKSTIEVMNRVCPLLQPRYRLSLEIIFNLYLMVFERIDTERGTFSTEELNPTPSEIRERVYRVIERQ